MRGLSGSRCHGNRGCSQQGALRVGAIAAMLTVLSIARFLSSGSRGDNKGYKWRADPFFSMTAMRGKQWGLNIIAWSAAKSLQTDDASTATLRDAYEAWRAVAERELAGTGAFVYPWNALHVTGATPTPFTAEPLRAAAAWTPADEEEYLKTWRSILRRAASSSSWPASSFPLTFSAPRFSRGSGIIDVGDPSGGVAALRASIADAAAAEAALASPQMRRLRDSSGEKTPNIVHSTVVRLVSTREAHISDEDLEERFTRAAKVWPGTVSVVAKAAHLVIGNEVVVMQQSQGGDAVTDYPYKLEEE